MKCAIFEEYSSSCVVHFRFSGRLFPVSMIDGDKMTALKHMSTILVVKERNRKKKILIITFFFQNLIDSGPMAGH